MTIDSYYANASSWRTEIIKTARTPLTYIKGIGAILVVAFLLLVAAVNALYPEGQSSPILVFGLTLTEKTKNISSAVGAALAVLFSLKIIAPLKEWYQPERKRYRSAAVRIIDSLRAKGLVDEAKENSLKDIAQRLLGAVEGETPSANPEEMLIRASYELAAVLRA